MMYKKIVPHKFFSTAKWFLIQVLHFAQSPLFFICPVLIFALDNSLLWDILLCVFYLVFLILSNIFPGTTKEVSRQC